MERKNDTINLKDLFLRYTRYWPQILICVMIAIVAAYFKTQYTSPKYWAGSKLLVQEEQRDMLINLTGMGQFGGRRGMGPSMVNEMSVLKSRSLAHNVLDRLEFDVEYFLQGRFINTEIYKNSPIRVDVDWNRPQLCGGLIKISWTNRKKFNVDFIDDTYKYVVPGEDSHPTIDSPILPKQKYNFGEWVEFPFARFKVDKIAAETSGEIIIKLRDKEGLVNKYIGEDLQVYQIDRTSAVIELSLMSSNPLKGRDYLNKLMEVFLENELEEKNKMAGNTVRFIDSQISGISDSLALIENQLGKFRSANKTYNITSEGSNIFGQMSELEQKVSQEKFKRNYYKNLQEYLVSGEYNEIIIPSGIGIEDPILNSLITNLIQLQSEKSRYLATQTEASPTVKEVNRKIIDLNANIKEVLKNVDKNAQLIITDLEGRIAKIEGNFSRLPQTEQNLIKMQREFTLNEGIYTFLLQRRAEAAISKASNTVSSKIIDRAIPIFQPVLPKAMHNYFIAAIVGFIFPISLIVMRDFFNIRITDIKDVENKLQFPVLSKLGKQHEKKNLVVLSESRDSVTEAFRSLRSNLAYTYPKSNQITIMVTSSISGEGKTFTAINLASVYSLMGKSTLIIGCDLRKPRLAKEFKINKAIGLSSYLSNQIEEINEIISKTEYPYLDLLISGPIPPNPYELLSNARFEIMLNYLKQKYEVIILDTPPIGLASESLDLIKLVDITLFVFRYNHSSKIFIEHANTLKLNNNLKNVYAVLNDIPDKEMQYGGYGYKYYEDRQDDKSLVRRMLDRFKNKAAL